MPTDERGRLVAIIIRQRAWLELRGVEFYGKIAADEFESIDHAIDAALSTDERERLDQVCDEARAKGVW